MLLDICFCTSVECNRTHFDSGSGSLLDKRRNSYFEAMEMKIIEERFKKTDDFSEEVKLE